jgi:branched-chain amino acid aminotransferase
VIKDHQVMDYRQLAVWVNGNTRPDAGVSVWDHGFLYGDGCFEGLRIRDGLLFRPAQHLARLKRSARVLALEIPYDDDELLAAVAEVAAANDLRDAHVRIVVTRGFGSPGLDPRRAARASVLVLAYPFPPLLGDSPINLMISSVTRKSPLSVDGHIKSLNYLDGILAKLQANAAGCDDAVMLDPTGIVAEGTSANLFVVHEDRVATPTTRSALAGITRRTVIELLHQGGCVVVERDITWGELYAADECFLTGTGAGIVSVGAVDGRVLTAAPGPITRKVRELYDAAVRSAEYTLLLDDRLTTTRAPAR